MSTSSVVQYIWRLFPPRQFYIRSRGSVRFYEFSPLSQIAFAGVLFGFLGWVAYSSVLVMFNENIIAAKDQQYGNMVTFYENKVSALQVEKEEINALLQLAEERFQNATSTLENKMRSLTQLAMQKQAMHRDMREVKRRVAYMTDFPGRRNFAEKIAIDGANFLAMNAESIDPVSRLSKGLEPNTESTIATVAASVIPRKRYGANLSQNVFVKRIGALEDRLTAIKRSQMALLREMNEGAQGQIEKLETQLSTTGLPVSELVASLGANSRTGGRGGPLNPDDAFSKSSLGGPAGGGIRQAIDADLRLVQSVGFIDDDTFAHPLGDACSKRAIPVDVRFFISGRSIHGPGRVSLGA